MPRSGELLDGRYRLGPPLGSGGCATVYEAVDTRLDRRVAVKAGPGKVRREASLLGRLSHPGLVTVHDAGTCAEGEYLVMERFPGRPLSDVLLDGPLPVELAASFVAQVADALAFVHSRGVVHGDVKPGNVLVDPTGVCKLADFGIARDARERAQERHGTPLYLSPEQLRGRPGTAASDMYSLGLVLLTCLTARAPFSGHGIDGALRRRNRSPELPTGLPPALESLLRRLTDPDPMRRPAAAHIARQLRGGWAIEAATEQLDAATELLAGRRVALLPALAVAIGVVVALGATSGPQAATAPAVPAPATTVTSPAAVAPRPASVTDAPRRTPAAASAATSTRPAADTLTRVTAEVMDEKQFKGKGKARGRK